MLTVYCQYILFLVLPFIASLGYNHHRLPHAIQPVRYKIRIVTHLDDPQNLVFTGDVQIQVFVLEKTTNITLHVQELRIEPTALHLQKLNSNVTVVILQTQYVKLHAYYVIHLNSELEYNASYVLTMQFAGKLNKKLRGYYVSSYRDKRTKEERFFAVTQFEPASARMAFPCFDEPEYKAKFIITLGHHMKYQALSNMPLKENIPIFERQNWQWSVFEESVPMSTYLVAYTINDFTSIKSFGSVTFRTWARPDAIEQCKFGAQIGPKILAYYEKIFDINFPLPKIDQVAVPDFSAGAMENWGLITYRETALLYAKSASSLSDKQRIAAIVAHELAHQWFGNLVTMKWWTDLWLNEGFATYVASFGVENLNRKWGNFEEESVENTLTIFNLDSLECSHPISQPIERASQIPELFDSISYKKGSAVIRMIHMFMGEEAFRAGLAEYLKKHAYGNAEQNDLWQALSHAAHTRHSIPERLDIKTLMDTWTLQTGYPLITVERDYQEGTIKLSQTRFFQNVESKQWNTQKCWYVPLSYTTEGAADFTAKFPKYWLNCNNTKHSTTLVLRNIVSANEWIVFNVQLAGLYRINYDEQNWQMIITTLHSKDFKRIHTINRAQLIDDALNLAWSGHRDYAIAFEIMDYLKKECEYIPWKAALENLAVLNRILRQSPKYEPFQQYMRQLLLPIYSYLGGLNGTLNERMAKSGKFKQPNAILHKVLIAGWACRFDLDDCVARALHYFNDWRSHPEIHNKIPNNLRTVVYCTAMRYGCEDDWFFLWSRYLNSNVAGEKRIIISALSCTREVWLLHRYLHLAYNTSQSHIRQQDASFVFAGVARGEIGYHLARDFFMSNIDLLNKFYDSHATDLGRLLFTLACQMTTTHDLEQLTTFVARHYNIIHQTDPGVRRAIETVRLNVQWRNGYHGYSHFTHRINDFL